MRWIVCVALLGCHSNHCPKAREAAATAVAAYANELAPAAEKAHTAEIGEVNAMLELNDTLTKNATCEDVRAIASKPQPNPDITKLLPGEGGQLEQIDTNELEPLIKRGELPAELGASLKTKHDTFHALLAKFDTEVPEAQRKKDRPWSAAQATYVSALSAAWCDLADQQRVVLVKHHEKLKARLVDLQNAGESPPVTQSRALETALRAGTQTNPVVIPGTLAEDPSFPTKLIRAVDDACK